MMSIQREPTPNSVKAAAQPRDVSNAAWVCLHYDLLELQQCAERLKDMVDSLGRCAQEAGSQA